MIKLNQLVNLNYDSFEIKQSTRNNIVFFKTILNNPPLLFKFKGLKLVYF